MVKTSLHLISDERKFNEIAQTPTCQPFVNGETGTPINQLINNKKCNKLPVPELSVHDSADEPEKRVKCPLPLSFNQLQFRNCDHIMAKSALPPPGLAWLFSDMVKRKDMQRPGAIVSSFAVDLTAGRLKKSKLVHNREAIKDSKAENHRSMPNRVNSKPFDRMRDIHFAHVGPNLYLAAISDHAKMRVPYAADFRNMVDSLLLQLY